MFLQSINKEVTLQPSTRRITRLTQECLFEWVTVDPSNSSDMSFPAINGMRSEELKVKLLFWLSDKEIDNITDDEYNQLKQAIAERELKKN